MTKQLKLVLAASLIITVVFCVSFVLFFLRAQRQAQQEDETPAAAKAPLPVAQLVDISGAVLSDDLLRKGKVILVFATPDCTACKIEANYLQTVMNKRPDIRYYGVISFGERKSALAASAGVFPFQVFFDENGALAAKLGVTRVPIKVYLEDGIVKKAWGGASHNEAKQIAFSEWLDSHR